MKIVNKESGKVIQVAPEHFENVLADQGWSREKTGVQRYINQGGFQPESGVQEYISGGGFKPEPEKINIEKPKPTKKVARKIKKKIN